MCSRIAVLRDVGEARHPKQLNADALVRDVGEVEAGCGGEQYIGRGVSDGLGEEGGSQMDPHGPSTSPVTCADAKRTPSAGTVDDGPPS